MPPPPEWPHLQLQPGAPTIKCQCSCLESQESGWINVQQGSRITLQRISRYTSCLGAQIAQAQHVHVFKEMLQHEVSWTRTLMAVSCWGVGPFWVAGSAGAASISASADVGASASARPSPGSKVRSAVTRSGSAANSCSASCLSCSPQAKPRSPVYAG